MPDECPNSGFHRTIRIEHGNQSADVDEKIAPLILLMWKNGIETAFSCQDIGETKEDPERMGWMSIQFHGDEKLNKFLEMILVPTDKIGLPLALVHPFPFFTWDFETYPVWVAHTLMMHSVSFPSNYVEYLTLRLTRRLEKPNSTDDVTDEETLAILRAIRDQHVLP